MEDLCSAPRVLQDAAQCFVPAASPRGCRFFGAAATWGSCPQSIRSEMRGAARRRQLPQEPQPHVGALLTPQPHTRCTLPSAPARDAPEQFPWASSRAVGSQPGAPPRSLRPRASSSAIPALASVLPKAGSVQTAARRSRSSCAEHPGTVQSPGRAAGRARSRPAPGIWRSSRPAPVPGEAEPAVHAAAVCSASQTHTDTMLLSALFLEDGVEMGLSWRAARQSLASGHGGAPNVSRLHTRGQLPCMQAHPFHEPYMHQAGSRAVTTCPATHAHGAPLSCSEFMGAQRSDCPAPAFPSLGFPVAEPRCCLSKSSLARLPCQ